MRRGLVCAAALLLVGCAAAPSRTAPTADPSGKVAVRVETAGHEGNHELARGQSATPPQALREDQPLPTYPAAWLGRLPDEQQVLALVAVNAEGELATLQFPAEQQALNCGVCTDDFYAAVEAALTHWHFGALEVSGWVDGPDEDGDGTADSVQRAVVERRPYSLRLRFSFRQIDGRPVVRAHSD